MKSGKAVRHPMIIVGALREIIERHMRIDGHSHDYDHDRMDDLVAELEEVLTLDMLTNSARLLARQKGE
jgi:hypothetical protein